jgi:hypothetical protein
VLGLAWCVLALAGGVFKLAWGNSRWMMPPYLSLGYVSIVGGVGRISITFLAATQSVTSKGTSSSSNKVS